jgi:ABC-type glycerol-3-phosphate transport system substrate-binding protein
MYKKILISLSLLIVASMVSTACGNAPVEPAVEEPAAVVEETEAEAEEVAEDPAEETPAEKPSGKLIIWVQQANQDVWEQTVLAGFQEMYPDIELEFVNYAPEEVASQVALAIQGGTGVPDLGVTQYRDMQQLIALQGLKDISDLMDPYLGEFSPEILAYCETDGVIYCTPWDIGPTVTYYRRDVFEAAGLSSDPDDVGQMVATWDDYLDTCITIKEKTGLPCLSQNKANNYGYMVLDMMWQRGIGFFDEKGAVTLEAPEFAEALEKVGEFWAADVTSDNLDWADSWYAEYSSTIDNTDTPPVATIVYPAWLGGFLKSWMSADLAGSWGIALMPAWEEGGVRASMAGGSAYFIPEGSANPNAAWAFIEYMALNTDNQVAQYGYSDYFPTLLSTYDSPLFSEPDPYYGDQVTRPIFAEVAGNVPYVYMYDSQYYNVVSGALNTAIQNYAMGTMSAADALHEAAEAVRLETGAP